MDFALSDEHRMLKDLVARFVREELMPLEKAVLEREAAGQGLFLTAARARAARQTVSRTRPLGPGRSRGRRRLGSARGRAGRRQRRAGQDGHALRAAAGLAESAHADGDRERRAARALSGSLRARRNHVGDRHFRARRRRRSRGHDHQRGPRRQRLGDQRPQDLDQPRGRGRLHHPHGGHRQIQGRARRHLRVSGRQGNARLQRSAQNPDDRRPFHLRGRAGGLPCAGVEAARRGGTRLRADADPFVHATSRDVVRVHRHGAARARHDVRIRAAACHVRRAAGRAADHSMVGGRRSHEDPRRAADGLRRGLESRPGPRRAEPKSPCSRSSPPRWPGTRSTTPCRPSEPWA